MPRKKLPLKKKFHAVKKKHADDRQTEISDADLQDNVTKQQVQVVRRRSGEKVDVKFSELKNVIADTMERLGYGESNGDSARVNNEEYWGFNIARAILYGVTDQGYSQSLDPIVRIVEEEYDEIPYCADHS